MWLLARDRRIFLPGETTHEHYQIELSCDSCHSAFSGVEQEACIRCHGEELERVKDTHPEAKFTDPRNADLLQRIDATRCVTCHEEHVPERTGRMGVTVPLDYCSHCHAEIAEERPSHGDYDFHGCASVGCHNFHDNTALYEEFLAQHLDDPELLAAPRVPLREESSTDRAFWPPELDALVADSPDDVAISPEILTEWERSAHARAGVNCSRCHSRSGATPDEEGWSDRVRHDVCGSCHEEEAEGFLRSRHGMRLAAGLEPMRPSEARLPMRGSARGRELGCTTCHGAHAFDTRRAAIEACLDEGAGTATPGLRCDRR